MTTPEPVLDNDGATVVPVADLHRNNNLSSDLYEVKKYHGHSDEVCSWELFTDYDIDIDQVCKSNPKIESLHIDSRASGDVGFNKYIVKFHRTRTNSRVRRMFPNCFVFPIIVRPMDRILVRYDTWNNVYIPI